MKAEDIFVGQKVRFREWDDMAAEFGVDPVTGSIKCEYTFSRKMRYLCGTEFEIKNISWKYDEIISPTFQRPNIASANWYISFDMVEPACAHVVDLHISDDDIL